jgi:uroporphyrinogen decarboxylase
VVSHPLAGSAIQENIDIQILEKRGRIPVYVEAIKRINILRGKQVAIMGVVTGPFTLATHLFGESLEAELKLGKIEAGKAITIAGNIGLKLCRTYCELGVDVIVINDEMLGKMDTGLYAIVAAPLKSIWNVARFFDVRSLILTGGCTPDKAGPIIDLQADGVSLGANVDGTTLQKTMAGRKVCYGLGIPSAVYNTPAEAIKLTGVPLLGNRKGCFITTDGEVPYTTSVETMQEIMQAIHPS